VSYRRRTSPLHAARAAAGCAYCLALACAALILSSPYALLAVVVSIGGAGVASGVGPQMRRALLFAAPLAVAIALINALVTRNGLTVIWRLGDLPALGQTDVTLEATVYGAVLGLRAVALVMCSALYTTAVDPDEVLRLFRRISFRSALTATLATRMVPVLVRDAHRLADAQRCRPGRPPSRLALMRAATSGALDRALDAAAALEVRGYGMPGRPPRTRRPHSRQDIWFMASAIAVLALSVAGRIADLAPFSAYPTLHVPLGVGGVALVAVLPACALLPFADWRGVER
jgi:energy-coupling factor transport system permease protein